MTAINERKKAYVIAYLKSRSFAINTVAFDIPLGSAKKQEKLHKKSPSIKLRLFSIADTALVTRRRVELRTP